MDVLGSLWLQRVTQPGAHAVQLHSHVRAIKWHDESDVLVALSLDQLVSAQCHSTPGSCCKIGIMMMTVLLHCICDVNGFLVIIMHAC